MDAVPSSLGWGWWVVFVVLGAVTVIRAVRWRDQPWGSSWIAPVGMAIGVVGVVLRLGAVALLGMVGLVLGYAVDRFYMWRADSTGHFSRQDSATRPRREP